MEKLRIFQILECNKTLYKMLEQRTVFPISVGLKIHRIMKSFNEIEEYIFETMNMTFGNFDWENMTNEQIMFYNNLISQEIEVEYEKIPTSLFENNEKLMLTIEDINRLSIILC